MVLKEDRVDLNAFLDEMVRLIDERLRKQEASIAKLTADVIKLRKDTEKPSDSDSKIDKSVLRILRQ